LLDLTAVTALVLIVLVLVQTQRPDRSILNNDDDEKSRFAATELNKHVAITTLFTYTNCHCTVAFYMDATYQVRLLGTQVSMPQRESQSDD
jgi:preprotein translocase subunit SecG